MIGQVYIIENELGLVKIGISSKPERRIKEIANASGLNITKKYFSKPCDNFAKIEKKLHEEFKTVRKKGEWFNIPFNEAVSSLNNCFNEQQFPTTFQTVRELLNEKFDDPPNSLNLMPDLKSKRKKHRGKYSISTDCKKNYKSEITKNVKKIPKKYTITRAEADKLIAEGKTYELKFHPRFKDEYISLIKEGLIKVII